MNKNFTDRILVVRGDITQQQTDAIVNAANNSLLGGGGVDGAINRAAGRELFEYNRTLGGCPTGEARLSPGFRLKARYIIHTVGPVFHGGDRGEDRLLASCYRSCFQLAAEHDLHTLAFPSISTGAYGFPLSRAVQIAVAETKKMLESETGRQITQVVFVCFDEETFRTYQEVLKTLSE